MARSLKLAAFAALASALSTPSSAVAEIVDDTIMVSVFAQACLTGELTLEGRRAAIEAAGWTELPADGVQMNRLGEVPSIERVSDFTRPGSVRQWQRNVDGKEVRAVLATYERGRYANVCAVVVPDVRNALPYLQPFEDAVEGVGLSGRSTDIPHYQEYSGRLADRRRARADIFSRTSIVATRNAMHMYIAFAEPAAAAPAN